MMSSKSVTIETPCQTQDFLDYALSHEFGDLHFKVCPKTGMKAMVVIHNTKRGPALGGCRFIEYPDLEAAIHDAMRLARGMSYKAALANLPLGGGKSVIIKPKGPFDREAYMHSFGQFIQDLNGRYITALDSGTVLADMDLIAMHTPYVASLSKYDGNPSPFTAKGVVRGIQAAVAFQLQKDSLKGLHIAIQGLGQVGYHVAKYLHEMGAILTVADVSEEAVQKAHAEFGARVVATQDIHKVACDVFSPCALGAIINDLSITQLQTTIIAGAANNQLAHSYHGKMLQEKGILFAVDYVINAGGLIFAAAKYLHSHENEVNEKINQIYDSLTEIFIKAKASNTPTNEIADTLAKQKLA